MRLSLRTVFRNRPVVGILTSVALHVIFFAALLAVRAPSVTYVVKRGEPLFVELPPNDESALAGNPAARDTGPAGQTAEAPAPPTMPSESPRPAPSVTVPPIAKIPPAAKATVRSRPPDVERPASKSSRSAVAARGKEPSESRASKSSEAPAPDPSKLMAAIPPEPSAPPPPASDQREPVEQTERARPEGTESSATKAPRPEPVPDIRAALGRGAAGGAGGRTDGRGGIEGEPIPLDSTDSKYSDYLDRIRRMIKEKWGYPCVKDPATRQCEYKTAQLIIEFGIAKNGQVPFINLRQSSGYSIMDDYALNAVKIASPFPPVPDSVSRRGIPILATFHYMVDTSLVNLLR